MSTIRSATGNSQSTEGFGKRQGLILAAEVLDFSKTRRRSRALLIAVIISTPAESRIVQCFINSEAEANFVSQSLVKNVQLKEDTVASELIEAIDEHVIRTYGRHIFDMSIDDSQEVFEDLECEFHAVNMQGYNIILGYPWFDAVNPDIQWHHKTWNYRKPQATARRISISICSTKEFASLAILAQNEDEETYVALSYELLVGEIEPPRSHRRPVRCEALKVEEPELLEFIKNLMNAFFEILSDSLNTHNQVKHAINLKNEQMPKFESIYNMSQDELAIIREYLENAQQKQWIRSSTAQCEASVLFVKKFDNSLRLCVDYRGLNEVIIKNNYPLSLLSETLKRFAHTKHFTKIDIRNTYHRIRIRKSDEWKTAFRTRYEQFEY